jgi:aspartyl-tRNA(Asn)/glutamyl-tRNA(Gln) amidotransferase subunit C
MAEEISVEVFDHLVLLAALELDLEESEYLRGQLNNQLKAIHQLERIDVDSAHKITSHGVSYPPTIKPPLRNDIPQASSDPQSIIAQAPDVEDGYIVVPDIPHIDLD